VLTKEHAVEEFLAKMSEKCGIDKKTAEKVVAFLKDHADDVAEYVTKSGMKDKLPGGLGKLF
jgi:hypothetical protein